MKSDFINCKNCTDDCHCKGKDLTPICISFKPAKTTNADRIRSMTDEELAEWIADDLIEPGYNTREQTVKMWLDWLKQEYFDNKIGEPITIKPEDVQLSDKVFPDGLI